MQGFELQVKGKVQGVGFRPFVWQLAERLQLKGEVLNCGEGVMIRVDQTANLALIKQALQQQLPPLARIDSIDVRSYDWPQPPAGFSIAVSQSSKMDTQVVPDAATCPECLAELLDSTDRRHQYPFINCTHCGPRFTLIEALPYDRANTVMKNFPLCPACAAEFKNPADRRYHAQPVACENCGPMVWMVNAAGEKITEDWLTQTLAALAQGQVVAIKSVGGFHLACDATNAAAVQLLRERKRRQYKPLAVMAANIDAVKQFAVVHAGQQALLQSRIAPIVLLTPKANSDIAQNLAPNLAEVGVMLPSNPLQHLIAHYFKKPVVMTSGNGSGLPPALDNNTALNQLSAIADSFVLHNRSIVQRCDDSLMRVSEQGQVEVLRRSRGLTPDALNLPEDFPDAEGYLAYGGDLKNAFAIGKGRQIIVSQYLGDLANLETQQQFKAAIAHYLNLYQLPVRQRVVDCHPGYFSRQRALLDHQHSDSAEQPIVEVQHHHAHIASCLVENGWRADQGQVLALALDGLGYGDHNELWGGELVVADYQGYRVLGGLPAVTLVGGDTAARQPWRSFYAHLRTFMPQLSEAKLNLLLPGKPLKQLDISMARGLNSHSVRSAGRLFDAVAASLGIAAEQIEYEGQAACELESLASAAQRRLATELTIPVDGLSLNLAAFWPAWLQHKGSKAERAYNFHLALAVALAELVRRAKRQTQINHLVLTGGVFHNALLTSLLKAQLGSECQLLEHQYYSCGDGGLALGQIAIALIQNEKTNNNKANNIKIQNNKTQ
ncbi:carbamoyltransferase HypF [Reinekea marinisedimentorum]|uniref:Carbamoyltransferase HypF n=1 Tax=Reinekea marinisedimentorum TaxID=230495 RepID=A0A4R3HUM6_9GAMM|nr:carbamoyltransferase HypF [Reinekea marinisedimentorum]TCS36758.1 hydrogenase maturation protein HypF [Reinekea marinisedimentorum]